MMNKTKLAAAFLGLALAGAASAATLTYSGSPFAIIDSSTNQGSIAVPSSDWGSRDTVRDIDCAIRLRHTWDSDIVMDFKGPSGVQLNLWRNLGGSSDNFNVIIDDEASANIAGVVNDGSRRRPQGFPAEALCWYDGGDIVGSWALIVSDVAGGDVGTVDAWSVTITGERGRFDSCLPSTSGGGGGGGIGSAARKEADIAPPGQHGSKAK